MDIGLNITGKITVHFSTITKYYAVISAQTIGYTARFKMITVFTGRLGYKINGVFKAIFCLFNSFLIHMLLLKNTTCVSPSMAR